MGDAVTSQTIQDGPKKAVMQFTNISDGTGETAVKKVDASVLAPLQGLGNEAACNEVRVMKIKWATSGMVVRLLWDASTDVVFHECPSDESGEIDYTDIGGLKNTQASGFTGDIMFSTVGQDNTDWYSIVLTMDKKYA